MLRGGARPRGSAILGGVLLNALGTDGAHAVE